MGDFWELVSCLCPVLLLQTAGVWSFKSKKRVEDANAKARRPAGVRIQVGPRPIFRHFQILIPYLGC